MPSRLKQTPSRARSRSEGIAHYLRRYPVSVILAAPYLVLILPAALIGQNQSLSFIVSIWLLALVSPVVLETLMEVLGRASLARSRRAGSASYSDVTYSSIHAEVPLVIGLAATFMNVLQGVGSIADQSAGAVSSSSITVSFLNLFTYWPFIGIGMLAAMYDAGSVSRRRLLGWVIAGGAIVGMNTVLTAIVAPLVTYAITVGIILIYVRAIRARTLIVAAAIALLVWPPIFEIRNTIRISQGAVIADQGAFDRLRYDMQIARAENLPVPLDVGQPRFVELLRYGFIPRFFDPGRPVISTGVRIASYLAGEETRWAFTFLPITTLYVLEGPVMVPIFYALLALVVRWLLRGGRLVTPFRMGAFALCLSGPLGWFATYPDSTIGLLQGLTSMAPLIFFVWWTNQTLAPKRSHRGVSTASYVGTGVKHHVTR